MQRRAISALLPAVLALWNPGPVSSVDAYRGNGTRGGSDEDEARTGASPVPTTEKRAYISYILYLDGQNTDDVGNPYNMRQIAIMLIANF